MTDEDFLGYGYNPELEMTDEEWEEARAAAQAWPESSDELLDVLLAKNEP